MKKTRWHRRIAGTLAIIGFVYFGYLVCSARELRIRDLDKVERGMTQAEVLSVLKELPSRSWHQESHGFVYGRSDGTFGVVPKGTAMRCLEWSAADGDIFVMFVGDHVVDMAAIENRSESFWSAMLDWTARMGF